MRGATLAADEERVLAGFGLLSAKPVIVLVNIGEERLGESDEIYSQAAARFRGPMMEAAVLCGALEMDLAQMEPGEEREMREGLGLGESGLDRMIALSHRAAGVVTFFTGNDNEVRAWTVPRGTEASVSRRAHTLGLRARVHPCRSDRRLGPAPVRQPGRRPPPRTPLARRAAPTPSRRATC